MHYVIFQEGVDNFEIDSVVGSSVPLESTLNLLEYKSVTILKLLMFQFLNIRSTINQVLRFDLNSVCRWSLENRTYLKKDQFG